MKSRVVKVLAVIGGIAIAAGIVGLVIGWGMMSGGLSARPAPSAFEEWGARKLRKLAVSGRYTAMKNPVAVDDATLKQAMEHWADHCATCHANDGSGQTTMGRNMYPRPPDMRGGRTQQMSDGEIYYVINQGIRLTGMPAWGEPGDDDRESWKLVAFIRKLPSLTPAEVQAMKAMNPAPAGVARENQEEEEFLNGGEPSGHSGH